MTDTVIIPRALLKQALDALQQSTPKQRAGEDEYAERGFKEHYAAMTALQSALEQPQQETVRDDWGATPEQLTKAQQQQEWLTGCPECGIDGGCGCDSGTYNPPKCKQCGDLLMSAFTQLCYGCQQEGMQ